jgi:hypothetical protein
MIIHTTSLLAGPVVFLIWCIDTYLFLVGCRLFLAKLDGSKSAMICQGLRVITDPLPSKIFQLLASRQTRTVPAWMPWLIVIAGALILRYLFLIAILTIL